ncbi:unnamed protein product [Lupinus luteus]|uniref:S-protein homolog n=1 Tax=Lupinus luteus TaxID=3873 RepID=A0AAV1WWZ7_LUPLU
MITVGSSIDTLLFSLFLLVASLMALCEGRSVYIRNDLRNGDFISVHCQSEDKDLGVQGLNYQRELTFPIKAKIFKTTIYTCTLTWNGRLRRMDVFNSKWDGKLGKDLKWSIQDDRPCLLNFSTKKYDLCNYIYS